MRRRSFLSRTAATSLLLVSSGCLASLTLPDSEYKVSSTEYRDETGKTEDNRPVSFSATVLGGEYDGDTAPVTVQTTMENTSDEMWYYRSRRPGGLFGGELSGDRRHILILSNRAEEYRRNFTEGCWSIGTSGSSPRYFPATHELQSGGTKQPVLELVRITDDTCPSDPPSAFKFSTPYAVYSDKEMESDLTTGVFSFSLTRS